jgi:hypothetical protein
MAYKPSYRHGSGGRGWDARRGIREPRMPLGVIMYVVAALSPEALWLGLIGWWLLHLF